MADRSVSGVILAAGGSARLQRPKQLLDLGGEPLLSHVLRHAAASWLAEVILVLGHGAETIAARVGDHGQRLVINHDYLAGQSTSVRAGLTAIAPTSDAVLFLLGDQPGVTSAIIDALISAYFAGGATIVVPRYGGQSGNPVLFDRTWFPTLAAVQGDQGARSILRAHPDAIQHVDVGPGPAPRDVDTEDDYRALLAEWGASSTCGA